MGKQKITMTIDEKIFASFKQLCKRRAMKVSSKVELMMLEFIEASDDAPGTAPKNSPIQKSRSKRESNATDDKKEGIATEKIDTTKSEQKEGDA